MMMPAIRLFHRRQGFGGQVKRSILTVIAASAMILTAHLPVAAQDDPGATYLEAQRLIRVDQNDAAREAFARLQSNGDEAWQLVGRSASALLDGDVDGARATAQQAVERNGESPFTHYQLGLVASRQSDWGLAANEFERATQLNGDLAYAHYYAGLAFQKQRQSAKAAEHLHAFLRLAPDAPERQAVAVIIRTLG